MTDRTCLTGQTATLNVCDNVKLAHGVGGAERLVDDELQGLQTEVLIDVLLVNGDNTGAGDDANTSNGLLSSAGAVEIRLCTSISIIFRIPLFISRFVT